MPRSNGRGSGGNSSGGLSDAFLKALAGMDNSIAGEYADAQYKRSHEKKYRSMESGEGAREGFSRGMGGSVNQFARAASGNDVGTSEGGFREGFSRGFGAEVNAYGKAIGNAMGRGGTTLHGNDSREWSSYVAGVTGLDENELRNAVESVPGFARRIESVMGLLGPNYRSRNEETNVLLDGVQDSAYDHGDMVAAVQLILEQVK